MEAEVLAPDPVLGQVDGPGLNAPVVPAVAESPVIQAQQALHEVVQAYMAFKDAAARTEYFWAHSELHSIFSKLNHPAPATAPAAAQLVPK